MLIVFAGLPGTGKTSLAQALATHLKATYLRIDTIEKALFDTGEAPQLATAGYAIAYKVAEDNLAFGLTVIADSVNPIEITRSAWRDVAHLSGVRLIEIEVTCSDLSEHRRRIETRIVETPVTWQEVIDREYDAWPQPHVVIDTAGESASASLCRLLTLISALI